METITLFNDEPTLTFPLEPIPLAEMLRQIRAEGKLVRPF